MSHFDRDCHEDDYYRCGWPERCSQHHKNIPKHQHYMKVKLKTVSGMVVHCRLYDNDNGFRCRVVKSSDVQIELGWYSGLSDVISEVEYWMTD